MRYLLDTGILVRIPHRADPHHESIRNALRNLTTKGHTLVTARQNIAEFWNVCTRPSQARGGFGLSIEETAKRLRLLERFITVLNEPDSSYKHWKSLVVGYRVSGRQVHDARIISIMRAYRITRILTLNAPDFTRFDDLDVFSPESILNH